MRKSLVKMSAFHSSSEYHSAVKTLPILDGPCWAHFFAGIKFIMYVRLRAGNTESLFVLHVAHSNSKKHSQITPRAFYLVTYLRTTVYPWSDQKGAYLSPF